MKKSKLSLSFIGVALLFSFAFVSPVAAVVGQRQNGEMNATSMEDTDAAAQNRNENATSKLEAAKLKVCEKREEKIKNIMSRIVDRGEKQLELFTKISDRVQAFYEDKELSVANYDDLVVEVEAKKADAQAALDAIDDTTVEFACVGTDPKGAAESFKEALKSKIAALKAYKTAVKDLLVAVKTAQGSTESEAE
jgi:hypothetical protein